MRYFYLFILILTTSNFYTQGYTYDAVIIESQVFDRITKMPLAAVQVDVPKRDIYTFSEPNGILKLSFKEGALKDFDTLYIKRTGYYPLKLSVQKLKEIITKRPAIFLTPLSTESNQKILVKGRVTLADTLPLQGVVVSIKNSLVSTETDENGDFSIYTEPDDVLTFDYISTERKLHSITTDDFLEISLKPKYDLLNTVVFKTEKKDTTLLEINGRKVSKDSRGFAGTTLEKEGFNKSAIWVTDLIRGRFPGAQVVGLGPDAVVLVRGVASINTKTTANFVVDNVPVNGVPNFLDVNNIESITLLPSLGAGIKYGFNSNGGVFLIRTVTGNARANRQTVDSGLVKGNIYKESLPIWNPKNYYSEYYQDFARNNSMQKAWSMYMSQKKNKNTDIRLYVDALKFFRGDKAKFDQVQQDFYHVAKQNAKALKTLAFELESFGLLKVAKNCYQEILELKPEQAQSYMDYARILKETGEVAKAFSYFTRMLQNDVNDVDFSSPEFYKLIETETMHLLSLYKDQVDYRSVPKRYSDESLAIDFRILLEWNDNQAEFDLQFVDQKRKYYVWSHQLIQNKEEIQNEISNGIFSKEFIIDDTQEGYWAFNLEGFELMKTLNPTFIKYTLYKNYGTTEETKKIILIPLNQLDKKINFDRIVNR